MNSASKYKKGNVVVESATIIVVLAVMAIFAVIALNIGDEMNDEIQADTELVNETKQLSADITNYSPSLFDNIFALAFIMLWAFAIIMAFMLDTHPMFFIFTIILFAFLIFVGAAVSNGWVELFDDDTLAIYSGTMPKMMFIFNNFPFILMGVIASIGIALYAKVRA